MTIRLLLLLLLWASLNATAQAPSNSGLAKASEETWQAACSSKINHPSYPIAALSAVLAGSVFAEFIVDDSGNATDLGITVLGLLRDLNRRTGQKILMITHNPEAATYGHRIVENEIQVI